MAMNQVWSDTRLGETLVGEAVVVPSLEVSQPGDVLRLGQLLIVDEFTVARQEHEGPSRKWTRDELITLGSTVVNLLEKSGTGRPITKKMLEGLYSLGIGPQPENYLGTGKMFPTVQDFRDEIGAGKGYSRGRFETWTTEDFVGYGARVEHAIGRKPNQLDYRRFAEDHPEAPSVHIITSRLRGGLSELNERLGYPNTKTWTEDDYIDFGVRFIEVNGSELFKHGAILALSARRRGPGYASILRKFDSWDHYKTLVMGEYEERTLVHEEERNSKLKCYRAMIDRQELPGEYAVLSDDQLLVYCARHALSLRVAPDMSRSRRRAAVEAKSTSKYVKALLDAPGTDSLAVGEVELEASILGVYDDLWPMDGYKGYIKVTREEIDDVLKRRRATVRRWRNQSGSVAVPTADAASLAKKLP